MKSFVVPWLSESEWLLCKGLVLSDVEEDLVRARKHIHVWKARVTRLPTGVETTLWLIDARLANIIVTASDASAGILSLTISAALNRFLNHLSHLARNLNNVTNYTDVASIFRIPLWIVDLRHETAHGCMPSIEVLKLGLNFSIDWIRLNYWEAQRPYHESIYPRKFLANSSDIVKKLGCILNAYSYLKLYQVWGRKFVRDLKENEDVYFHVVELWSGISTDTLSQSSSINGAIYTLISYLSRLLKNRPPANTEIVINMLINDDLLLPFFEHLESMMEDSDDESFVQRPPATLILVWADILKLLDDNTNIINRLILAHASFTDSDYRLRISCGWIMHLLEISSTKSFNMTLLENALLHTTPYSSLFIPKILHLYGLNITEKGKSMLLELVDIYLGGGEAISSSIDIEIKCLDDLFNTENTCEDVPIGYWNMCNFFQSGLIPIGLCPEQDLDNIDLVLNVSSSKGSQNLEKTETCLSSLHKACLFDWDKFGLVNATKQCSYSDKVTNHNLESLKINSPRKRKRSKHIKRRNHNRRKLESFT